MLRLQKASPVGDHTGIYSQEAACVTAPTGSAISEMAKSAP